jgi:hypothetical protein
LNSYGHHDPKVAVQTAIQVAKNGGYPILMQLCTQLLYVTGPALAFGILIRATAIIIGITSMLIFFAAHVKTSLQLLSAVLMLCELEVTIFVTFGTDKTIKNPFKNLN